MKKSKLKLITKILAIIVISLISFVGIYVQKYNKMENIVKGYQLSKNLSGYREIVFELSEATEVLDSDGEVVGDTDDYDDDEIESNSYEVSDTPVNAEEDLTVENYEKSKSIIEERLKSLGVEDYNISLEKSTGKIYLQIPEDDLADRVVSNVTEIGDFEIKDSTDGTVYLDNSHIKSTSVLYNTTESGTTVYLEIKLNKEGKSILKDLSENEYATLEEETTDEDSTVEETSDDETSESEETSDEETSESEETTEESTEEETTEESEDTETSEDEEATDETSEEETTDEDTSEEEEEEEEEQKEITLSISGSEIVTTSFDDPIEDGVIDLSMSSASTDTDTINDTIKTTTTITALLNSGELPLTYDVTENQYAQTEISDTVIRNIIITGLVIMAVLLVFMIIKNKLKGLLGVISFVGFGALYLLLIRYTNVAISMSGMIAIGLVFLINYIFNMKLLSVGSDKKAYKNEYLKFIATIVPLLVISIVFTFISWVGLSSFGMLLFWGLVLILAYNILITKSIID